MFNSENEKLVKEFHEIHSATVTAMDYSEKSNILVTGTKTGDVCISKLSSDMMSVC